MAIIDELKDYIYSELPKRIVLLSNDEAVGNPNISTLSKVKFAPLGTYYLQSDIIPHPLFVRVNVGSEKDWIEVGSSDNTKIINFQYFGKPKNIERVIIPFPCNGILYNITAKCNTSSTEQTEFTVEKINEEDFKNNKEWTNILSNNIIFNSNSKIGSGQIIKENNEIINKNDIFRCKLISEYANIEDLNIQLEILVKD